MKDQNHPDIEKIVLVGMAKLWQCMTKGGSLSLESSDEENHHDDNIGHDSTDVPLMSELEFVHDHLMKYADGVILWVVLIIRELITVARSGACTRAELQAMLSKIPTTLNELYHDILERVKNGPYSNPEQAQYIFLWLIFGRRTLRVAELRDALAMFHWDMSSTPQDENFLANNRVLHPTKSWRPTWTRVTNLCGNFIEIVPKDRDSEETIWKDGTIDPDDSVQLIHQTAKDFLLYDSGGLFMNPDPVSGIEIISTACVEYLKMTLPLYRKSSASSRPVLWKVIVSSHFVSLLQDRPLLVYILEHLPIHLRDCSQKNASLVTGATASERLGAYLLSVEDEPLSTAFMVLRLWIDRNHLLETTKGSLSPSARPALKTEWSGYESDESDDRWLSSRTMLFACKAGAINAVRILLQLDPSLKDEQIFSSGDGFGRRSTSLDGIGGAPLCAAAQRGDHRIVKLLLERGARTDVSRKGNTPLHLAISGGHVLVVKELLHYANAGITTQNGKGLSPKELSKKLGLNHISGLLDQYSGQALERLAIRQDPLPYYSDSGSTDSSIEGSGEA
jgi:hypothetical protein